MPLQSTSGAASYDAFGGGAAAKVNYIEDFFQSYLRTGTGASATVTTGLDGSAKETLVWTKSRSAATNHKLTDNVRGATKALSSNTTGAEATDSQGLTAFSATGYTIGTNTDYNNSGATYVDWQWVAQPKFFDVVTFTGTQNSSGTGQVVSHNLGSTPGCVIIKPITDTSGTGFSIADWIVWHRSLPSNSVFLKLNSSASQNGNSDKIQAVSSTTFTAGWEVGYTGQQYVAYLFAHDAGGFGLTGTDNVISCGSFTTNGSSVASITLGYEPQWVMTKRTDSTGPWGLYDTMRGWSLTAQNYLLANDSGAEGVINATGFAPNATGFTTSSPFDASATYIYIAIRRGPMKVPTSGTSVFYPNAYSGTGTDTTITSTGFPPDLFFSKARSFDSLYLNVMVDRLRGASQFLVPTNTIAETEGTNVVLSLNMNGVTLGGSSNANNGTVTYAQWNFRRAPSFFDEVCYTGTGSARTITHNLGAVPELMIMKRRDATANWPVYTASTATNEYLFLNSGGLPTTATTVWNNTAPTSSVFSVGTSALTNASAGTYVAYLFASCAGVSKIGSYTGTGALQTINCGFTSGARFVLIKLISSGTSGSGDWYVWDSARGISSGNDPYLLLNSTSAEVTGTNYVDTDTTGFKVTAAGATDINASGNVYLFLAIA